MSPFDGHLLTQTLEVFE